MLNRYYAEMIVLEHHARDKAARPQRARELPRSEVPRMGVGRVFESWRRIVEWDESEPSVVGHIGRA
jgi:hypothetical protein